MVSSRKSLFLLFILLTVFTSLSSFAVPMCGQKLGANSQSNLILDGRNVLVTGATFGIGKETALGLARMGARVTIVGRDLKRTEETVRWIQEKSSNAHVDYLLADLSELKQVKALAQAYNRGHDRLDVLVNNAGALFTRKEQTSEGIEKTWALNHLSPLLLTLELESALKKSGEARVVNVASALYEKGDLERAFNPDVEFKGMKAYGDSKLANVLSTFYMAERLRDEGILINCLHPGFVDTGIGANNKGLFGALMKLTAPLKKVMRLVGYMITPEEGAETSIFLASSPAVQNISGRYFYKKTAVETTPETLDQEKQKQVWNESLRQIQNALKEMP